MSKELDRLKARFDGLFGNGGLTNIKFFVRGRPSRNDFVTDVNKIQDTIAAGAFELVEVVDKDFETRKFNEPF